MIEGHVTEGKFGYQRITYIKPTRHDYGDNYYKYSCPVCDMLGNRFSMTIGLEHCPQCNVNLCWEDYK